MELQEYQSKFEDAILNIKGHPTFNQTPKEIKILDFTNAIAGEAGELANVGKKLYRKSTGYKKVKYLSIREQDLKEELADVLSNCMEFIIAMGWDFETLLLNKLKEKQQKINL